MLVFQIVLGVALAVFLQYKLVEKMGFRGIGLWLITLAFFVPPINLISIGYLLLFPWPIHKEMKRLKEYIESNPPNEIDIELDRLRGELGMNQMRGRKPKKPGK